MARGLGMRNAVAAMLAPLLMLTTSVSIASVLVIVDFGPNGQWVIYHTLVMNRRVKPPRPKVSLNPCIPRQSLPDLFMLAWEAPLTSRPRPE